MKQWVATLPDGSKVLVTYWEPTGDLPEQIEVCLRQGGRWSAPLSVERLVAK